MEHSFDVMLAQKYGVNAAVLLKHFEFWIAKNKANGKNYFDGKYWTYNSRKAFAELFPYMNARQIDYAIKKLIDDGLIITGNYNKSTYDRTLWYAITKKGYCILQNCEMEVTKLGNGFDNIVEPIPDINTDINTDLKQDNIKENNIKEIIDYLNEKALTAYKYQSASTQRHIKARLSEGFTVDDFKKVIDHKVAEWGNTDFAQYLRPETLFGTKFESYLNAGSKKKERSIKEIMKMDASDMTEEEKARLKKYYKDNGMGEILL